MGFKPTASPAVAVDEASAAGLPSPAGGLDGEVRLQHGRVFMLMHECTQTKELLVAPQTKLSPR